jgi:hypothetical protein
MATIIFVAASCFSIGNAFAEKVNISGKHDKSDIKRTCDAVGGDFTENRATGRYGCNNICKNQHDGGADTCSVTCKEKKCTGTVPDRRVDEKGISDVLNNSIVVSSGSQEGGKARPSK